MFLQTFNNSYSDKLSNSVPKIYLFFALVIDAYYVDSFLFMCRMSGYNWKWPQIPSLTAMKYQRHGYVERRPFEIGERLSGRRDLEKYVKGYRWVILLTIFRIT